MYLFIYTNINIYIYISRRKHIYICIYMHNYTYIYIYIYMAAGHLFVAAQVTNHHQGKEGHVTKFAIYASCIFTQ